MKFAISGTHFSGKTALINELSHWLENYTIIEEPYYLLEEEGYAFLDQPSIEDYEKQLEYSIEKILESGQDTIFDRCPLDFLAYINVHEDASYFDQNSWSEKVTEAMDEIDFIVFVPIENPDLIVYPDSEDSELRQKVDIELQDLVYAFEFSSSGKVLEVNGTVKSRLNQVLSFINSI